MKLIWLQKHMCCRWLYFRRHAACVVIWHTQWPAKVFSKLFIVVRHRNTLTCVHLILFPFQLPPHQKLNLSEMTAKTIELPGKLSIAFSDTIFCMWCVVDSWYQKLLLFLCFWMKFEWKSEDSFQHYFHLREMHQCDRWCRILCDFMPCQFTENISIGVRQTLDLHDLDVFRTEWHLNDVFFILNLRSGSVRCRRVETPDGILHINTVWLEVSQPCVHIGCAIGIVQTFRASCESSHFVGHRQDIYSIAHCLRMHEHDHH